nr:pectinesterase inhibitor-like [Ipomoea batatas]GME16093.1 pectinesterase inhibitor-like [Ipomoea batatas]
MKPSVFALLSFLLYTTVLFSAAADERIQVIQTACAETQAPDLCVSVVESDPRSVDGDVKVFSTILLEKAVSEIDGLKERCPEAYRNLVGDGEGGEDALEKLSTKHHAPSVKYRRNDVVPCSNAEDFVLTLLSISVDVLNVAD